MAQLLSLAEALDSLVGMLAPGPPFFDTDLAPVSAGAHSIATARLTQALLRESFSVRSVATTLWTAMITRSNDTSASFGIKQAVEAVQIRNKDQRGWPLVVSVNWETTNLLGQDLDDLKAVIVEWASQWFKNFLLPIQGRSRTPSAAETSSSGRLQQTLKAKLLLRDGHTSPISDHTDWDTPDNSMQFYNDSVGEARLIVAHIIPFSLSKRADALDYLAIFSGGRVKPIDLIGSGINKTSNAFLLDSNSHAGFDRFHFAIKAETSRPSPIYTLECFSERKSPPRIREKAIKKEHLAFGRGEAQDLPDVDLCNIHYALGRVLHAAAAAEIIEKIMRDESDFLGASADFTGLTDCNADITSLYLFRKLQSVPAT